MKDKDLSNPIVGNYIGEIRKGKEIGKTANKYVWNPCPMCRELKWALFTNGRANYPHCPKCSHIIVNSKRTGKTRVNKELNTTPPLIGEIRLGFSVGKNSNRSVMWHSCEKCGATRWVWTTNGKPIHCKCATCGKIGRICKVSFDKTRECSKCHAIYPATKEYFATVVGSRIGISRVCIDCRKAQVTAHARMKRTNNSKVRVHASMSSSIRQSLSNRKEGRQWEKIVGYTCAELIEHLEKQFLPRMDWSNYGHKVGDWSIDHIIPVSAFNFESADDMDFYRCWALSNLQPLWHLDNMKKSNKVDKPFQPSLALGIKETRAVYTA